MSNPVGRTSCPQSLYVSPRGRFVIERQAEALVNEMSAPCKNCGRSFIDQATLQLHEPICARVFGNKQAADVSAGVRDMKLSSADSAASRARGAVRVNVPNNASAASFDPQSNPINQVTFNLNGKLQTINNPDPEMTLNEYIRSQPGLTGTKKTCGEGGCGACTVMLTRTDTTLGKTVHEAINSCLRPVCALDSTMNVNTIESIGSQRQGFHPLQEAIAEYDGTQCGFCTPGQVMNMYSMLQDNPQATQQQIEDNFDGNLCRCTGYRPILEAFKTFASDAPAEKRRSCKGACGKDIEDLCRKNGVRPSTCGKSGAGHPHKLVTSANGVMWYNATSTADLQAILSANPTANVKLVVGNTSVGVIKDQHPDLYVNVANVPELLQSGTEAAGLFFGAAVTIADVMTLLNQAIAQSPGYQSANFVALLAHMKKVANVQVRNVASWAGNLMMTHDNADFPSDLATILYGAGATVDVVSSSGTVNTDIGGFLSTPMQQRFLQALHIPYGRQNETLLTYKTMLRHQNAHAIVNAAFRVLLDSNYTVVEQPTIVYGGIQAQAFRLTAAETALQGQAVTDRAAMANLFKIIGQSIQPDPKPGKVAYRASVANALFYKFVLAVQPPGSLASNLVSAATPFVRPISSGTQTYSVPPGDFPVGEPIHKLTGKLQASGEAVYVDDIPAPAGCLYAALVTSTQANATIQSIDPSAALALPGVVAFYSAKDLPEAQNIVQPILPDEEVFASSQIYYYGQVLGVVVADSQRHANDASKLVSVTYANVQTPILTFDDAIQAQSYYEPDFPPVSQGDVNQGFSQSAYVITGQVENGSAAHFHMETHTVLVTPDENQSLRVFGSTQWPTGLQSTIAHVTGKAASKVYVETRRLGGGFGAKATRTLIPYSAVAFASDTLGLPVRMAMDLNTNFNYAGKRHPFRCDYKIGVDQNGKAIAVQLTTYCNKGHALDGGAPIEPYFFCVDNCYNFPNFLATAKVCKTNIPPNTATRGPGWMQAIFIMEHIMEHVAAYLNKPPEVIKSLNFYSPGDVTPYGQSLPYFNIPQLWSQIMASADYANRSAAVAAYNAANRWTKRGLSLVPIKFGIYWSSDNHAALVNILADGSVGVVCSGIEMGQGLNTKVAQAVAYGLGVPLKYISVLPVNTTTTPNAQGSGGSVTSELNVRAALNACDQLNAVLAPVRASMPPNSAWTDVIAQAVGQGLNLQGQGYVNYGQSPLGPQNYNTYAVGAVEVLIDVLTGEQQILRVDILFDCGVSLNPVIDIGQVEGGFIQGAGMHTTEEIIYDSVYNPGVLLTNGTWEYKPPASQDIPIDFRISLLKDAPNPIGILRSKATGEPPLTLACSVLFALQHAIAAARSDAGQPGYFELDSPATVDRIQQSCLVDPSRFTF